MAGLGIAAGLFAGQRHYMEMQKLQEELEDKRRFNEAAAVERDRIERINRKLPPRTGKVTFNRQTGEVEEAPYPDGLGGAPAAAPASPAAAPAAPQLPPAEPVGPGAGAGAAPSTGGGRGGGGGGRSLARDKRLGEIGPPPGQPAAALPPGPTPSGAGGPDGANGGKGFGRGIQSQPYADDAVRNNDPTSSGPYRPVSAADAPERYGPDSTGAQMGVDASDYMDGRRHPTGAQMAVDASDNTGRPYDRRFQSQPYAADAALNLSPDTSPYVSATAGAPEAQGRPYELPTTTETSSASAGDAPYGGNPSFASRYVPRGLTKSYAGMGTALGALAGAAGQTGGTVARGLRNAPFYMLQNGRPAPAAQSYQPSALPPSQSYAPQMDSRDPYAETRTRRALDPRYLFTPPAYGN